MNFESIRDIQGGIESGKFSVEQIVNDYLQKIEENQQLNAFLEVFPDETRKKAQNLDQRKEKGEKLGQLAGVVIGIKDNICFEGHKVSASSKILEDFESLFSATVVERLIEEDAIIIGRLNCDEFAMGSSSENSAFGNVHNPINTEKVPGGSSGGSAAAVAAGLCHIALGSDTGGSIRQPASFTGTIGFKPTYGSVSRHGLIAYASSFDQIGPFTKTIEDAALAFDIMKGRDEYDATLRQDELKNCFPFAKKRKLKIGYIQECLEMDGMDPELKKNIEKFIEDLRNEGHIVEPISFPYLNHVVPAYYVLTTAEASSNLARYNGVHVGKKSKNADSIETTYVKSRTEGFGEEVKRRIMTGTFVLSAGYYDAYYGKSQKVRRLIKNKTDELLGEHDFLLSPTTPTTAFDIDKKANDPIAMYLQDIFTVQANLSGNPAISLPLIKHSNGMPAGVQLMGNRFEEKKLLSFSNEIMSSYNVYAS